MSTNKTKTRMISDLSGAVVMWPLATPPDDWLECDGSAISRADFADLFDVIGTAYGVGDGATTFNLPDMRGEFVRGYDNTAGNDPDAADRTDRGDGTTGDNVGTKQIDAAPNITGVITDRLISPDGADSESGALSIVRTNSNLRDNSTGPDDLGSLRFDASDSNAKYGDSPEVRSRNVSMMFIIKT